MKLGLQLPNTGAMARTADLVAIGHEAEELGYDSVWVTERLINPPVLRPESVRVTPRAIDVTALYFDPIVAMAAVGHATSRVRLGTRVLLPVLRGPVLLAKEIGTLASFVGADRLVLGVGAGWMYEEFEAVGIDARERFARLDESVSLMRHAWEQGFSAFEGRHYRHVEAGFLPVPASRVPILIGGTSEGAIKRVAALGDGWAMRTMKPGPQLHAEASAALDQLRRACDAVGRDYDELSLVTAAPISSPPETFETLAELGIDVCVVNLEDVQHLTTATVDRWLAP